MNDELLSVLHNKVDDHMLRTALNQLLESTKLCNERELELLHKAGKLPTGCMNFVIACRVKIV